MPPAQRSGPLPHFFAACGVSVARRLRPAETAVGRGDTGRKKSAYEKTPPSLGGRAGSIDCRVIVGLGVDYKSDKLTAPLLVFFAASSSLTHATDSLPKR